MRAEVVRLLRCPVCGGALSESDSALVCPARHTYDIARQGYVDLSGGQVTHGGDTADMVAARHSLLEAGHFRVLTKGLVAAAARPRGGGLAVDVGAGTGHHLAALLDARPDDVGLAFDVSKAALRRAARAHPRLAAVRADAWRRLPVADGAASLVVNVFAPRSGAEFARVLRPDGALVVATPAGGHLRELVDALELVRVDPDKPRRLAAQLEPWFAPVDRQRHTWSLTLSRAEARAVVAMGPSAWHTEPGRLETALAGLPAPVSVTAAVDVSCWSPRGVRGD